MRDFERNLNKHETHPEGQCITQPRLYWASCPRCAYFGIFGNATPGSARGGTLEGNILACRQATPDHHDVFAEYLDGYLLMRSGVFQQNQSLADMECDWVLHNQGIDRPVQSQRHIWYETSCWAQQENSLVWCQHEHSCDHGWIQSERSIKLKLKT